MKTNYPAGLSNFKTYLISFLLLCMVSIGNAQQQIDCSDLHAPTAVMSGANVSCINSTNQYFVYIGNLDTTEVPANIYVYTTLQGNAKPIIDNVNHLGGFTNAMDTSYIDTVSVNSGPVFGTYVLIDSIAIVYKFQNGDSCIMRASASQSLAVVQPGASAPDYTALCLGGTVNAAVHGHTTPPVGAASFIYTLVNCDTKVPIAPMVSNTNGIFNNLVAGNTSLGDSTYCVLVQTVLNGSGTNTCDTITRILIHQAVPQAVSCTNDGALTCMKTTANLSANSCTGSGILYSWTGPNGFNSTLQCPTAPWKGTYKVVATNSSGQCPDSCSTTVDSVCHGDFVGCTLGFWKNHVSIWKDATSDIPKCIAQAISMFGPPYSGDGTTNSSFATTFGLSSTDMMNAGLSPTLTLLQALKSGGGSYFMLARQGVASLIDGCSIKFQYTSGQVISMMHTAITTQNPGPMGTLFGNANETQPDQCPAAGRATKRLTDDLLASMDNVVLGAYPNPFNGSTNIEFELNTSSFHTVVEIFNVTGEKVVTLFDGQAEAGHIYTVKFDGAGYSQGIYFTRITTDDSQNFEKLILIK